MINCRAVSYAMQTSLSNSTVKRVIVYDGIPARLIRTMSKKCVKRADLSVEQNPNPKMCNDSESEKLLFGSGLSPTAPILTVFSTLNND